MNARRRTIAVSVAVALAAVAATAVLVLRPGPTRADDAPAAPADGGTPSAEAGADGFKVDGDRITVSAEAGKTAGLRVVAAEQRSAPITLDLTGRTGFDMEQVVHVHAPFAGRIVELGPELGSTVTGGPPGTAATRPATGPTTVPAAASAGAAGPTPLCTIESTDLANAKNGYLKAKVQVDLDQVELTRTNQLAKETIVAPKAVLDAEIALRKDQLDLELARQQLLVFGLDEAAVEASQKQGARQKMLYTITAPRSGIITEKNVTRGELADNSSNLFTISDLSTLWLWGDVYERDFAKVRVGQPVKVYIVGRADRPIDATLDWISPVIDDTTRSVRVRATLDNRDRHMLADMYATLTVTTDPGTGSVVVPADAVVHDGERAFSMVEVSTDGGGATYRRTPVEAEAIDARTARVTAGVHGGDRVVADGALGLYSQMQGDAP